MGRVIPIYPSPLDMEFRDAMVKLINSAREKIILFENPKDGLSYLVVDGKHWMRWAEPGTTVLSVESRPRLLDGLRISTLETLYGYDVSNGYDVRTGKREVYAEFERYPDGSYDFRIVKEMKQLG